ncbi:MAG TPA: Fic/DOC family N-terminal domain-containing protein [bacterium]|nr:Fic/DOC family N-terminal domain-containing protein [bacterium]
MTFDPTKPFNDLPLLPPAVDIETRPILKQLAHSRSALAELKGYADMIPNKRLLLDAVVLLEAKDSSAIENIVTTHDELYKALVADPATLVAQGLCERRTASKYLSELEAAGLLISQKDWKTKIFINTPLFDLLKRS